MFISFVWTLDAGWRTCQEQWTIGTDDEWESRKYILSVRLDDDDDDDDSGGRRGGGGRRRHRRRGCLF